jgi:hypothetical protein
MNGIKPDQKRWWQVRAAPLSDGVLVTLRDISAEKQAARHWQRKMLLSKMRAG